MTFKEYFNDLKIPLKETSKNFVALFHAIALAFESVKKYSNHILSLYFIQSGNALQKYAEDRGIVRVKNEGTESHFQRVLNAYAFLKNSSTLEGLTNILKLAISKEFTIRELYLDNWILGEEPLGFIMKEEEKHYTTFLGADYTSYYFVVTFDVPLTLDEKNYLDKLIDLYKPAHTGCHIDARIVDEWKLDDSERLGITTYIE